MAKDYIPRPNGGFDLFHKNLVKRVVLKAIAWNIPIAKANELNTKSIKCANLYHVLRLRGNGTSGQVLEHEQFRIVFESYLRKFVNAYIRNNQSIIVEDMSYMGIKTRGKRRNKRTGIHGAPQVTIESIPGAYIRFVCRVESSTGRGSIHPESDGIEIRYSIGTELPDFNKLQYTIVRKRAHVKLDVKPAWRGKYIYAYVRWVNLTDDERSGPWSVVLIQQIY